MVKLGGLYKYTKIPTLTKYQIWSHLAANTDQKSSLINSQNKGLNKHPRPSNPVTLMKPLAVNPVDINYLIQWAMIISLFCFCWWKLRENLIFISGGYFYSTTNTTYSMGGHHQQNIYSHCSVLHSCQENNDAAIFIIILWEDNITYGWFHFLQSSTLLSWPKFICFDKLGFSRYNLVVNQLLLFREVFYQS